MASNNIELSHLVPTVTQRVTSKDAKDSFGVVSQNTRIVIMQLKVTKKLI